MMRISLLLPIVVLLNVCSIEVCAQDSIRLNQDPYNFWYNTGAFDANGYLANKKLEYRSLAENNPACYEYLMYIYYNHYRMIEKSVEKNYFLRASSINDYLNGIAAKIREKNNHIINHDYNYEVLVIKSAIPNAFSFGEGYLGVTMGLLTLLDNEDEIASVLCHEISHDLLNHHQKTMLKHAMMYTSAEIGDSIDYILNEEAYDNTRMEAYLAKVFSENFKKNSAFESQADSLGIILLGNSAYNTASAADALLKMSSGFPSKDSLTIISYLKSKNIPINEQWIYKGETARLKDVKLTDIYFMDTIKTHPEIANRVAAIKKYSGNNHLALSENPDYEKVKFQSLVQLILDTYISEDVALTLHYTMVLKNKFPDNTFADKMVLICIAKSAILKYNLRLSLNIGHIDSANYLGQNQAIQLMFNLKESDAKTLICQLESSMHRHGESDIYAYTANLYAAYYCSPNRKYNEILKSYRVFKKNAVFRNDLIYLRKKS